MGEINKILNKVENGELKVEEAVKLIKALSEHGNDVDIKGAAKIKIKIHDRKDNRKITLPQLPIWFIDKMAFIGLKFFNKHSNNNDLKNINYEDIKELFSHLRMMPPFQLVKVDNDETEINIYTT